MNRKQTEKKMNKMDRNDRNYRTTQKKTEQAYMQVRIQINASVHITKKSMVVWG